MFWSLTFSAPTSRTSSTCVAGSLLSRPFVWRPSRWSVQSLCFSGTVYGAVNAAGLHPKHARILRRGVQTARSLSDISCFAVFGATSYRKATCRRSYGGLLHGDERPCLG